MELAANLGYLEKRRGTTERRTVEECAKIVKQAGFNYIDLDTVRYTKGDDWKDNILKTKEILDKTGLMVEQTHEPSNWLDHPAEEYKEIMKRAFEVSKIAGAKNIIIHADKYLPDENGYDPDKASATVYEFYAPFVEYAINNNLGVAIENLFEGDKTKRARYTSKIEEQLAIIKKFDHPLVTACWDFGHGQASYGKGSLEQMKKLGSLLTSTHVHDNIYQLDLHGDIFSGEIDWETAMKYLREIGYKGKFTLEPVYGSYPDGFVQEHMKHVYKTAKFVVDNF